MDIICINDLFSEQTRQLIPNRPIQDKVYSIRELFKVPNYKSGVMNGMEWAVLLNEIHNPHISHPVGNATYEPSFSIKRFRNLDGTQITDEQVEEFKKQLKYEKI